MSTLVAKVRQSLERDRELPLAERARKALRYLAGTTFAPIYLRACDQVGRRCRTIGRPRVENSGRISIGDDVVLSSEFSPIELITAAGGEIEIGRGAHINFGTSISAASRVTIGEGTSIGPYCLLEDSTPGAGAGAPEPIVIGSGVWLAGRVTVLPGSRIGAGAVITAGSIVSGEIPPNVVAGGIPARPLKTLETPDSPRASSRRSAEMTVASPALPERAAAPALRGVVLADFTVGDLAVRLRDAADSPAMEVVEAPYAQTAQYLLRGAEEHAQDFAIVWTRVELACPTFQRILDGDRVNDAELLADVDAFVQLLQRGAARYHAVFVPLWTTPLFQRGLGMIDARPGGLTWALALANQRLMSGLATTSNIYLLNASRWLEATSSDRAPAKGWYLGKVPFTSELFAEAAREIKAAMRALSGQARKLLVLDLDDTLWGGIVGDSGWEQLNLGGHDGAGEAFVDFQRAIKSLTHRGVVLGIVSKNTEEVALEALRMHPEMVLRPDDFVGWRINWSDKAQNIADLAAELNLGLQSVVFIDDNPAERARVRETLPEVLVPEWPEDKLLYPQALLQLRCFDTPAISAEDAVRTRLYAAERQRDATRAQVGSLDEWLATLDIRVEVDALTAGNLARVTQLLNKTNQMNLTTRRVSENELLTWSQHDDRAIWAITVSDRFGTAGLTGVLGLEARDGRCHIVDFVLSCRVMGRRIEDSLVHIAVEWARERELQEVVATYLPTAKNKPCHDFWKGSGFASEAQATRFSWSTGASYDLPSAINLAWRRPADAVT